MIQGEVTRALVRLREGDSRAADELLPQVYDQLRQLAQRYLAKERSGHTLQPTALVHEAYIRMVGEADWRNRAHFFAVAARAMRRILVDHARVRAAAKRGGPEHRVSLELVENLADQPDEYVVALDAALERLAAFDSELAKLVELRFFGGMNIEEAAEALGISARSAKRHWTVARGWLHRAIARGE